MGDANIQETSSKIENPQGINKTIWEIFSSNIGDDQAQKVADILSLKEGKRVARFDLMSEIMPLETIIKGEKDKIGERYVPLNVNSSDIIGIKIPVLKSLGGEQENSFYIRPGGWIELKKVDGSDYTFLYTRGNRDNEFTLNHYDADHLLKKITSLPGALFIDGGSPQFRESAKLD